METHEPPVKEHAKRELYILDAKHGISRMRLYFDGPAGPDGQRAFEQLRVRALAAAPEASDIVEFKSKIWQIFSAADFHPADK